MCDQHHADRHILCSQCDMLVALPELGHGHKAACPRCGATLTTEWDAPRQRPTAYALAALFMLLLSNLFPFISMKVGGMVSRVDLLEIPRRDVLGRLRQPWHLLSSVRADRPGFLPRSSFCYWSIASGCPPPLKIKLARILFQLKSWGMAEIFLAGILGQLREADGLRRCGDWQQLYSVVSVLRAATARVPVRGPTLGLGTILPRRRRSRRR